MNVLVVDLGAAMRGGQIQTLLVAEALARRGHEVGVAVREGSPLAVEVARPFTVSGRGEASPGVLLGVRAAVRRLRPDVIYASEARGHGAVVWSRSHRRCPLVVHRRVAFPPRASRLSRIKYRAPRRFLAISRAVAASLQEAGVEAERIAVVPDMLPPGAFVETEPPPSPPFRLVHVGAFDGKKGQDVTVDVLRILLDRGLDARVRFLGDGPARRGVEARARDLGVDGRCEFPGRVERVAENLASSHLLLLPSESEGASVALIEAMAAGCPVLVHDVGGAGETIREAASGRAVGDLDPRSWADAASALLGDAEARERSVAAGRVFAAGRRAESVIGTLEEELARAVESEPPREA